VSQRFGRRVPDLHQERLLCRLIPASAPSYSVRFGAARPDRRSVATPKRPGEIRMGFVLRRKIEALYRLTSKTTYVIGIR
jgi:hypothetical protein